MKEQGSLTGRRDAQDSGNDVQTAITLMGLDSVILEGERTRSICFCGSAHGNPLVLTNHSPRENDAAMGIEAPFTWIRDNTVNQSLRCRS
ncbi:hypothetical protein NQZ68_034414 [Dissostichus eleginoides]|nr:hypothetical protein NQZ68_034414 [Dissostichus eleginoides]